MDDWEFDPAWGVWINTYTKEVVYQDPRGKNNPYEYDWDHTETYDDDY